MDGIALLKYIFSKGFAQKTSYALGTIGRQVVWKEDHMWGFKAARASPAHPESSDKLIKNKYPLLRIYRTANRRCG